MKIYQATIYQLNEALAVAKNKGDKAIEAVLTMSLHALGERVATEEESAEMELQ